MGPTRYRVWKALDEGSYFFGISGVFKGIFAAGLAASAFAGVMFGSATEGLFGFILSLALAAGAYLFTVWMETRMTSKELKRVFHRRNMPGYLKYRPQRMESYLKKEAPWK